MLKTTGPDAKTTGLGFYHPTTGDTTSPHREGFPESPPFSGMSEQQQQQQQQQQRPGLGSVFSKRPPRPVEASPRLGLDWVLFSGGTGPETTGSGLGAPTENRPSPVQLDWVTQSNLKT